ncbi:DUF3310 domain-containing protein [Amorphus orientalis]|uniref:Uncharacterized protein n=1 Tax=Amorphus orientalis TaxID=649198 RepID=A0AAE3VTY6_9HYPH|nr:DUF3310 domain-containing protein [Amorphus orientalis]MDQ0317748.1 hypothetical protein [Amorphus orientalis]
MTNQKTNALDRQVSGGHYKRFPIQPVEVIAANGYDFFLGNILEYVIRAPFKGGKSDLEKALHHAELRRDVLKAKPKRLAVRKANGFLNWAWALKLKWTGPDASDATPIPMSEFIQVNHIPEYDDHVLYALDEWHQGRISADYFITTLRIYVRNRFPDDQQALF